MPTEVEKINRWLADATVDKVGQRQVAGERFTGEATDDHFFVRRRHKSRELSQVREESNEKGAERVVNSLLLCYIGLLRLTVFVFLNASFSVT